MTDPFITDPANALEPVRTGADGSGEGRWTRRLVLFLRVMAGLSMLRGLYHWEQVIGIGVTPQDSFEAHAAAWQTATVFFAVIDLVAAVGLWLAAAWGAVVWLTATVSMIMVELVFPQVYGSDVFIVAFDGVLLALYVGLALKSAREHPP